MSQEAFKNEKEIRRFLLGEMPEPERAAFEEKFIAEDAGLFDEIGVAEDELIESYIRNTLSAIEKQKFEQNFMTTKARRRRVAFTREMFDKLAAEKKSAAKNSKAAAENRSVLKLLIDLFKTPKFAFGFAFAALLLAFGFWFLVFRSSEKRGEIVQKVTPTPSQTPSKVENNSDIPVVPDVNLPSKPETSKVPSNTNADNLNKTPRKPEIPKPAVVAIALFAGTVRSEGTMPVLDITKETNGANFVLNLESRDYQIYRAEIVDGDGSVIYRSGKITARKSRITTFFPTAKLKKGDYFVKLYGFNSTGEEESAADFQFRVNQK